MINWDDVRRAYPARQPLLNLNNAAVSPPTLATEAVMIEAFRFINQHPDVNMWEHLDGKVPAIKAKLAALADCRAEEIALNRNSSEGLCTAIFGLPMGAGDGVLLSDWDYASMRASWLQRRDREGIEINPVSFDMSDSDDAVVEAYARAITPRTKAMLITHMLHWTGRVLPLERLCRLAREHGVTTIVDGAQSFAQIPFSFRESGCDVFVTSLHKWLCAPVGNGMMIVRDELIDTIWPLLSPYEDAPVGINKFDTPNLGTLNCAAQTAIEPAIDFHNAIGTANIHDRLRYLTRYWTERAADIRGFRLHTPLDRDDLAGVSLFSLDHMDARQVEKAFRARDIRVRYREVSHVTGVRVSPHIYTTTEELDAFVGALRDIAQ
jgi:selenocysteine lyase/cysteine desulfurase